MTSIYDEMTVADYNHMVEVEMMEAVYDERDNEMKNQFNYVIDLDERGSFSAHVEDQAGKSVFSFNNEVEMWDEETEEWYHIDGELWLVEDGFMNNIHDVDGLCEYLIQMGVFPADATLTEE